MWEVGSTFGETTEKRSATTARNILVTGSSDHAEHSGGTRAATRPNLKSVIRRLRAVNLCKNGTSTVQLWTGVC